MDTIFLYIECLLLPVQNLISAALIQISPQSSECIFYLSRLDTFSNIEISVISLRNYIATVITSQYNPYDKVIFSYHLDTVLYFFNETKHYWYMMHSILPFSVNLLAFYQ